MKNTIKSIVSEYLKANKYDGLVNTEIPCGCLLDDLMPCGLEWSCQHCEAGHRVDRKASEKCDCDGCGTDHWEVVPAPALPMFADAAEYVCECGQVGQPGSGEWRWNGSCWEHYHGYPIGHVAVMKRKAVTPSGIPADQVDAIVQEKCRGLRERLEKAEASIPEDVRSFVYRVTLHLQSNRSKTPEQHDAMFQEAYRLYDRYDVEGRRSNTAKKGGEG